MSTVLTKTDAIESKIERVIANGVAVSRSFGGLEFANMGEVMEFAKLMSVSGQAVPPHCRTQPGVCLGIIIQSLEWRMSPYSVANKSYVVNDRLAYESQLIHAVIEQRAPITARLRHEFSGSGPTRRCRVWATHRGESEPLSYESPECQTITPKNSPLWKAKPDLQLYYNTSRDWARMYFPDVILGVYAEDEMKDFAAPVATVVSLADITAKLQQPAQTPEPEPQHGQAAGHEAAAAESQVAPPDSGIARVRADYAAATTTAEVEIVYDRAVGPDSSAEWTAEQVAEIERLRAERKAEIRAART